ncbi:MAG: hypothetical protein HYV95_06455 [Opitutae bacterium]|nr:hypothetical protein [Opitutae bacterium]
MSLASKYHLYATSLLADIQSATDVFLPRRDDLARWLTEFLLRSAVKGFHADAAEVENLIALDAFVRLNLIPVTRRESLA